MNVLITSFLIGSPSWWVWPLKRRSARNSSVKRRRQAERREQLGEHERADLRDESVFDPQYVEREGPVLRFGRRSQVVRGRRLRVGPCDNASQLAEIGIEPRLLGYQNRVPSLVPGRVRRHRQARVLAQELGQRVDVGSLVRVQVASQ